MDNGWAVAAAPVGGEVATGLLWRYFAELASRYIGRPAGDDDVAAALADEPSDDLVPPTGLFLVAREREVPAGCVGLRWRPNRVAELTRLFVVPAFRGRGGGLRLLAAAERAATGGGAAAMRLDTRHDLVEARALYAKHGYREIPPYSHSPYADHWFEKRLV